MQCLQHRLISSEGKFAKDQTGLQSAVTLPMNMGGSHVWQPEGCGANQQQGLLQAMLQQRHTSFVSAQKQFSMHLQSFGWPFSFRQQQIEACHIIEGLQQVLYCTEGHAKQKCELQQTCLCKEAAHSVLLLCKTAARSRGQFRSNLRSDD